MDKLCFYLSFVEKSVPGLSQVVSLKKKKTNPYEIFFVYISKQTIFTYM